MDVTADVSTFPVDLEGSLDPGQLPEFTFRNDTNMTNQDYGTPSHMVSKFNSGRHSPVRGRTMKEYDKQISDLKKENFNLKIRIFHMEERMQQRYGDGQDVYKTNIELQVQVEKLKKDLADKQDLIQKAGMAMDTLRAKHDQEKETMKTHILSDFKDEMNRLQAHVEDANKECERYRIESEDAEKRITDLQQKLDDVNADLCGSKRETNELNDKLKNAVFDVQHLTAQLKLTEQTKSEKEKENDVLAQRLKDISNQLQDSKKDMLRKERDLQNLSAILLDQSLVDSTSILEPVHKQDEIDDALDTIKRKDDRLDMLEDQLKQKDNMVGTLEDTLREMDQRLKENEAGKKENESELEQLRTRVGKFKKSIEFHMKALLHKDTELEKSEEKLKKALDEIETLQQALKQAELEKTQTLGDLTKEVTELDIDNRRLKLQLVEADGAVENMAMSLGKKEGELAGFQDQLKRAIDALRNSDEAVEALHDQLKAERAEFDRKLKELALKQKIDDGKNGPSEDSKLPPDLEKMEGLRKAKEVTALEKELEALKAELHGKDLKIQNLESGRILNKFRTVYQVTEKRTEDRGLPEDLLTDLKMLLVQLQKEMASLSNLHKLLAGMKQRGDTSSSAELLLTEISSVQRIYRQLEGGVEKNSQLHQALLDSLRGEREHRQSDSPDSNSCQDGGHNVGHSGLQLKTPDRKQQLGSHYPNKSVGVETSPQQVDRSFQTGTALSHTDQWVQTSPGAAGTADVGTSAVRDAKIGTGNANLKGTLNSSQSQSENSQSFGLFHSASVNSSSAPVHPARHSHVRFADTINDERHTSLTDDAKGVQPQSAENTDHIDFCDFNPGVLFDEDNFDVRAHDRASSARFYSRSTGSLTHNCSESAAIPSSTASSAPTSSACNITNSALIQTPGEKELFPGLHASPRYKRDNVMSRSLPVDANGQQESFHQNRSSSITGKVIDFNHQRSSSFISPGIKDGRINKSPASQKGERLLRDREVVEHRNVENTDITLDKGPEERGEQRSRRNSWAEELEQYRVHDQDRGADQQTDSSSSLKQQQVIANMSAVELRDLVAQLQVDLVHACKENRALQEELKAVPKRASVVNAHTNAKSGAGTKSKIPRLNASSSCHSTTSDDSDQVDSARSEDSGKEMCNGQISNHNQLNGQVSKAARTRTASAEQEMSPTLQSKLNDSHALIKNLQNKLHATENTVRLLSKKNKAFVSALESAGISTAVLNRSNSESCLTSFTEAASDKTASMANLSITDQSRRLASLLSPLKDKEMNSREMSRAMTTSLSSCDPYTLHSSPPRALARSPTSTTTSCSPGRTIDTSASSNSSCQQALSTANAASQFMSGTDISEPGIYFKVPAVPSAQSKGGYQNGQLDKSQLLGDDTKSSSPNKRLANGNKSMSSPPMSKNRSIQCDASVMDVSAYPDMTYTSLLDTTLLHKLHRMSNMDHSLSATFTEDLSSMSVDQLQGRLEHLERVNLTLREEINVYEAIHRSQGTQVSPSFYTKDTSASTSDGPGPNNSDQDLLRQHLEEIRKLRHRLERLDITKDPEQLLIFQSHTQQRITRQETMLAHLQQQMVEKEEQHLRECTELQHRLAREKATLGERLEQTISDLQKQLEAQAGVVQENEQQIQVLKQQLLDGEDREKMLAEKARKIQSEKSELEDDLVKRDKEFLEMEKMMFRLEMAKENANSDCRKMEGDLEAKEKDCDILRKEINDYKENSKCLKEIVVKREKTLQEKVHSLQKMSDEKAAVEIHSRKKENQVKLLEEELKDLRKELEESRLTQNSMKEQLQSDIEELKSDLRRKENLEERNLFQKAGYEAEITRLTEERMQMKSAHERELDTERMEARRHLEDLRNQLKEKQGLETELEMLRDRIKIISELQCKVEKLERELDFKACEEAELREKVDCLSDVQAEAKHMKENLNKSEEEKAKILEDLSEREEKLKKRDKQLKNLISQHMKLETTFSKQKNMLKEKIDLIHSQKKQLRLFEVSLTCSSQEEKDDIMKQLLKELIATQRQVEELLSRLEQNPIHQPTVRVETYGVGNTSSIAGMTTTVTTSSGGAGSSTSSGQDNIDTALSGVREGSLEKCLGSLSPCTSEAELEVQPSSPLGSHTTVMSSTTYSSPLRPVSTNLSPVPLHYSLSPRQLRYYADSESLITSGTIPQSMVGSDIRSLFAVLKLENHEKLRKETSESLVILSTMEARLEDRLKAYKAMPVSESLDYSTMRETSMSCKNLRLCLEEAVKLTASAWITELPPVDARGHFYDPVLAEQNENLKRDLTVLRSRYDVLDHTVKEQQGRLQASTERHKNWEQSLYKQLHKTAQDMEKAKENFDVAGFVPRKNLSLRVRSPNKPQLKRPDDTI